MGAEFSTPLPQKPSEFWKLWNFQRSLYNSMSTFFCIRFCLALYLVEVSKVNHAQAMKVYGGVEVQLTSFSISALEGGKWSASC